MLREDGFTVLPPVLAETRRSFRLERAGTRAASARRVLRILEPARLVSVAPDWRDWLERSWLPAEPPAAVLFPPTPGRTPAGGACWRRAGPRAWPWPDDIFAADLDRLNRTFEGVVLWHRLSRAGC